MKNAKYILFLIIVAGISILIFQKRAASNHNESTLSNKHQENVKNLLQKPLKLKSVISPLSAGSNAITKLNFNENKDSLNYVFILLSKGDCYDCYRDISFWNKLNHISPDVRPFIVIKSEEQKYMLEFIKGQGIKVPVLIDTDDEIFPTLSLIPNAYTPICFFINKKGVIMAATQSNYGDEVNQSHYYEYIRKNI